MLVRIGSLLATGLYNFEDCIDSDTLVRVDFLAGSVHYRLRQICRVDTAGEKHGGVVVYALVVHNFLTKSAFLEERYSHGKKDSPSAPGGPAQ